MNVNQIVNMVIRMVMRKVINKGVNASMGQVANLGRKSKVKPPVDKG